MKIWKEVLAEPLVSVVLEDDDGATWGRVLGVSDEQAVMRMVENTGEIGPLVLFKMEDVQEVALDWRAKASLIEVMDVMEDGPCDPQAWLSELVNAKAVASLKLRGESSFTLVRLESLEEDWIEWTEFTVQGIQRLNMMVPLERIQYVETDGTIERALAARLAEMS